MKLYSIKNTQTDVFNPPFVARDDVDAKETVRKAIVSGRDISLLVELENLELYNVASFDAKTGYFSDECPVLIQYLHSVPLPDHLNKMIAKLKEVKE